MKTEERVSGKLTKLLFNKKEYQLVRENSTAQGRILLFRKFKSTLTDGIDIKLIEEMQKK